MNFTSQDIAIIERALRTAMHSEKEERRMGDYREVLLKLQESTAQVNNHPAGMKKEAMSDGIRFDYDDSSELL
jgi:hypothetical protein